VQTAPQAIPPVVLVRVPVPDPSFPTVRETAPRVNVAVTLRAILSITVQLPSPLHPAPLQPVKAESATGVAVSVTTVPLG